jgi:hypothetical protein
MAPTASAASGCPPTSKSSLLLRTLSDQRDGVCSWHECGVCEEQLQSPFYLITRISFYRLRLCDLLSRLLCTEDCRRCLESWSKEEWVPERVRD